jgi:hypothetical protein
MCSNLTSKAPQVDVFVLYTFSAFTKTTSVNTAAATFFLAVNGGSKGAQDVDNGEPSQKSIAIQQPCERKTLLGTTLWSKFTKPHFAHTKNMRMKFTMVFFLCVLLLRDCAPQ